MTRSSSTFTHSKTRPTNTHKLARAESEVPGLLLEELRERCRVWHLLSEVVDKVPGPSTVRSQTRHERVAGRRTHRLLAVCVDKDGACRCECVEIGRDGIGRPVEPQLWSEVVRHNVQHVHGRSGCPGGLHEDHRHSDRKVTNPSCGFPRLKNEKMTASNARTSWMSKCARAIMCVGVHGLDGACMSRSMAWSVCTCLKFRLKWK